MHNMALSLLRVAARPGMRSRGLLIAGRLAIPVVLGRTGIRANKREGDGATPRGRFRLRRLWWRADRGPRPPTLLPTARIDRCVAWCEDPGDRRAIIGHSGGARPMNQATGSGATTGCTTSSSRSTTTPGPGLRAGGAPCSCMWRGQTAPRPQDASPSRLPTSAAC